MVDFFPTPPLFEAPARWDLLSWWNLASEN